MKLIASLFVLAAVCGSSGCVSKSQSPAIAGRWVLVAGGQNEHVILDLRSDRSYFLRHWVDFHDINGEDKGSWSLSEGVVSLTPTVRGTPTGEVFLPYHCAKLQIATSENDLALVSVSVPIVPHTVREHAIFVR